VGSAENGKLAMEYLENDLPDIILMDCHMPEMDGYEATRRIKGDIRIKDIPVIAMTANALDSDRQKCMDAGMNDFITKPFDRKELEDLMYRYKNML
jgi:two-component system, sensor histidine kinase SagS